LAGETGQLSHRIFRAAEKEPAVRCLKDELSEQKPPRQLLDDQAAVNVLAFFGTS